MANKKSFLGLKFIYDAPATLTFAFVCIILFALDTFVFKQKLASLILTSPVNGGSAALAGGALGVAGAAASNLAFSASNPLSYLRLFSYALGAASGEILVCNMIFILLLGPSMEERYGTVVIAIMTFVSALFSGVLNACFCKSPLQGCEAIIFMMIFLNSFVSLSKKKIPFSFVLVFILFVLRGIFSADFKAASSAIQIIINVAGGLCGSLFAFLTSPKAKAAKKSEKQEGGLLNRAESYRENQKTKKSLFAKKNDDTVQQTYSGGDETVISSMRFDD